MKQDETGLKRERIRNVEEVIFSVCKGKGWEASFSSQDEENWRYATISVTKYTGGGRINGTFEITLDDRFRIVPELIMDFNSILNDGGWKELTREINVQVMKIPWLKTKAPIVKETQPVEAKSSKTITADKKPSKNAENEEVVNIVEDPTKVFVVHGRNDNANKAIFSFLRSIGLKPLEWSQIIASMNVGSPYIGDILDCAFNQAQAVVVLLTPDDEARLRDLFRKPDEQEYEIKLTAQARPNVLFEAGMAFGRFPERTILVELGKLRPFSDITGRHTVKLDNSTEKRQDLAQRLRQAGCPVDLTGTDWHSEGKFYEALFAAPDEIAVIRNTNRPSSSNLIPQLTLTFRNMPDAGTDLTTVVAYKIPNKSELLSKLNHMLIPEKDFKIVEKHQAVLDKIEDRYPDGNPFYPYRADILRDFIKRTIETIEMVGSDFGKLCRLIDLFSRSIELAKPFNPRIIHSHALLKIHNTGKRPAEGIILYISGNDKIRFLKFNELHELRIKIYDQIPDYISMIIDKAWQIERGIDGPIKTMYERVTGHEYPPWMPRIQDLIPNTFHTEPAQLIDGNIKITLGGDLMHNHDRTVEARNIYLCPFLGNGEQADITYVFHAKNLPDPQEGRLTIKGIES